MSEPITWTNVTVRLGDLQPWPRNPRQIKEDQARRLSESFDQFGQVETLAIGPDGEIYNGHQRLNVLMAESGPDYEIEARQSSRPLTEKEREKLTVYLHKGAAGEWDFDALSGWDVGDLLDWGFEDFELGVEGWGEDPPDDPGAQVDRAEELRKAWGVEPGQLWRLGEHRLFCGDCTDAEVVSKVMRGERADLLFTSPPYNVDVQYDEHDDTNKNETEYMGFIELVCLLWAKQLDDGRAFIWNIGVSPRTYPHHHAVLLEDIGLKFIRQYVWKKMGVPVPYWYHTIEKKRARYVTSNYIHEIIYVFGNGDLMEGEKIEPDENIQHDVLTINQTMATRDIPEGRTKTGAGKQINLERRALKAHPAAFPVDLPSGFISCYSAIDEIIVDPFLGSGTTLIACERLGRRCRAVEISPAYCAVAIERWAQMTGGEPELLT